MSFWKKLITVQSTLIAKKGQYNSFGKYHYRSCEDVLESVKPLLAQQGLVMFIQDEIKNIGERYYIEAKVTVTDGETTHSVVALAREDEILKGMTSAQITGATSSYARKYALNGMFLIDDSKDADTNEFKNQTANNAKQELKSGYASQKVKEFLDTIAQLGGEQQLEGYKAHFFKQNFPNIFSPKEMETIKTAYETKLNQVKAGK